MPNLEDFESALFEQAISHFQSCVISLDDDVFDPALGSWKCSANGSLYTVPTRHCQRAFYATGGFTGKMMTDQASGFGRGFDV